MKEIWIQYKDIIFPIVFYSFGALFFSLNFYIFQCYKLKKYKEQVDQYGRISEEEIKFPFGNFAMIFYIFTHIPIEKKYYKFDIFNTQVKKIKSYRKFYRIAFPIYMVLISVVLYIEIKLFS